MYTTKEIIKELNISYQTFIRWERRGFIKKPNKILGRYRVYNETEFNKIKTFFNDVKTNPEKYKHLSLRLQTTGKRK